MKITVSLPSLWCFSQDLMQSDWYVQLKHSYELYWTEPSWTVTQISQEISDSPGTPKQEGLFPATLCRNPFAPKPSHISLSTPELNWQP